MQERLEERSSPNKEKSRPAGLLHPLVWIFPVSRRFFNRKIKKYGSPLYHGLPHFVANDSNFDRNPLRGCNYGLEGGAFLILGGGSSLPKDAERLHEIMC